MRKTFEIKSVNVFIKILGNLIDQDEHYNEEMAEFEEEELDEEEVKRLN